VTAPVAYPRHPAHLDPYVAVLGPALTLRFLLEFGGQRLYLPDAPKGKSAAEALIGAERLAALSARLPSQLTDVPIAKVWVIQALTAEGRSVNEIVAQLRTTRRTVVKARAAMPPLGAPAELPPLPLFDWRE
jgi:hypothetical protein